MKVCTRELQKSHQTTYTDTDTILSGPLVHKLQSLTLFFLDILFGMDYELLNVLAWRHEHGIGLESLVVQECHVGLRAAKGGSEVGLGSVDRGGSCWW